MATYQFYAYARAALSYDAATRTLTLRADYDATRDRILVTITDNDASFNGDHALPDQGDDTNQTAVVTRPDGTPVTSGRIYDERFGLAATPDGGLIRIDLIKIGDVPLGCFASEPMVPGHPYALNRVQEVTANNDLTYSQIHSAPCFAPGTMIRTGSGDKPVEWLDVSDRILTRDHGDQPLLWSGRFTVPPHPSGKPPAEVSFAVGSLGPGQPHRPLRVTGCHRMLLGGADLALHFGENEVLAAAEHMLNGAGISRRDVAPDQQFYHLLLPDHEVILANGVWTESLFAGGAALDHQPPALRHYLLTLIAGGHRRTARLCLKRWEAGLILRDGRAGRYSAAA